MTDGIARAMSAGYQSPLAPSDEGLSPKVTGGETFVLPDLLCLSSLPPSGC